MKLIMPYKPSLTRKQVADVLRELRRKSDEQFESYQNAAIAGDIEEASYLDGMRA